jgi:3-phenylpropionate/trans-cinnamate dioxygenase ferredoxin component
MSDWVALAKAEDIPPGQCRAFDVDDRMIAVFNLDGEFHATDNICTHEYAELCDGMIIDGQIQCPMHGARFDIRTGAVTAPPAYEPLNTYPVRLDGDTLEVDLG